MNIAQTLLLRHNVEVPDNIVSVIGENTSLSCVTAWPTIHVLIVYFKIQARNPYLRCLGVASCYQNWDQ
jgi:hypothetical protein